MTPADTDIPEENDMTFPSARRRSIAEIMEDIAAHRRAEEALIYELISEPAGMLGDSRRPTDDTNGPIKHGLTWPGGPTGHTE